MAAPPPPDPLALSEPTILRLRPLSRPHASALLLTAETGPLDPSCAFSADVAGWAYFVHLAWTFGRHAILEGKPSYEAREMLGSRVRSSVSRSGSVRQWGSELLRSVGVRPEKITAADALWWRGFADAPHAPWRILRRHETIEDVLTASALLTNWLWQIRGPLPDADLSDLAATATLPEIR